MFHSLKRWLKPGKTTEAGEQTASGMPVEETIPEETIPEETIPEETIPEETIPEETTTVTTNQEEWIVSEGNAEDRARLNRLQDLIGSPINPNEETTFLRALRHRSLTDVKSFQSHETYERLEFLGDAVLELIVSELIYEIYPEEDEGFLTKLRAKIVRGKTLAHLGERLGLDELAEISSSAVKSGKRHLSQGILADLFESLVAALYLTKGFELTRLFVREAVQKNLDVSQLSKRIDNFKSLLMEHLQAGQRPLPVYRVMRESGPDHQKIFTIGVYLEGELMGKVSGKSKKEAEQRAAKVALDTLNGEN